MWFYNFMATASTNGSWTVTDPSTNCGPNCQELVFIFFAYIKYSNKENYTKYFTFNVKRISFTQRGISYIIFCYSTFSLLFPPSPPPPGGQDWSFHIRVKDNKRPGIPVYIVTGSSARGKNNSPRDFTILLKIPPT